MTAVASKPMLTGGCQCGAIRFALSAPPKKVSICHCRMCQKAFGGYFAPLVSSRGHELTWTRGALKYYQSSNFVKRGFCGMKLRLARAASPRMWSCCDGCWRAESPRGNVQGGAKFGIVFHGAQKHGKLADQFARESAAASEDHAMKFKVDRATLLVNGNTTSSIHHSGTLLADEAASSLADGATTSFVPQPRSRMQLRPGLSTDWRPRSSTVQLPRALSELHLRSPTERRPHSSTVRPRSSTERRPRPSTMQ